MPDQSSSPTKSPPAKITHFSTLPTAPVKRLLSGIHEWDRVVGNGIMPGSLLTVTGDPGIGKSTLLLQIAHALSKAHQVYYFSTEESLQQMNTRAIRLACNNSSLYISDCAQLESIITTLEHDTPDIVIIDSIQSCYTNKKQILPGSIGQIRETIFELMRITKEHTISIIISGHITKEGMIAGPKTLEHMVDAVFYLQGEDRWQTRVLRAVKNRFGTINEVGFFHMTSLGLEEVTNINQHLLDETTVSPGSALTAVLEGSRPFLLELQALTIASKLAIPQRVISGIDHKQVVLIAAILEKYLQVKLSTHDIFFKISGALKIKSNVSDLGIALALLSSYFKQPLPEKSIALGEINVTGHIKAMPNVERLTKEAFTFGITHLFLAKNQSTPPSCTVTHFATVYELLQLFS
jgi:DNA repair protein RadA/Sms